MTKIKFNLILGLLLFGMIMSLSNCTYNNEEELYPEEEVEEEIEPDPLSYTNDVLPIIENNCYSCHGNGATVAGIDLDGYDNLVVTVENGSLLGTIQHDADYSPMPQGAGKLPDNLIEKVSKWIDEDYPNN